MSTQPMIARQGDVLLIQVEAVPDGAVPIPRDAGRIVLAYGEVTGHAHAIFAPDVSFVQVGEERYIESASPILVQHEEHAPVRLGAGAFRVVRQREYSPSEIRNVAD
jgi:hypothetical protein